MNPTAIYSKSGKGVQEASGKTSLLSRSDRAVLSAIDGRATLGDIALKVGKAWDDNFQKLVTQLDKDGFIREVSAGTAPAPAKGAPPKAAPPAAKPGGKPAGKATEPMDGATDLDFSSFAVPSKPSSPPPPPQRQAVPPSPPPKPAAPPPPPPPQPDAGAAARAKEQQSALQKAREEAEAKAQAERDRIKAEMEAKMRAETETKLRAEAETKAKADAEAKIRADAEAKAKAVRDAAVKAAVEAKQRAEAESKARQEAERKAKEEIERTKREAEEQARKVREEADRARKAAEEEARKAREEAERVRKEAAERERQAREEAERKAKELEEERRRLEEERKREEVERAARRKREEEEEAERRRKREEEDAARRKEREEADAAREKEREEKEAARRQEREQEEQARKKQREDEDRSADEERAAKRKKREEADAAEQREEEERAAKRKQEREEAARRQQEEEAEQARQEAAKPKAKPKAPEPAKAEAKPAQGAGGGALDSLLADLDSFSTNEENDRKAAEEDARKAKEEAARRAKEDAERREREEAERKEKEAARARKEEEKRRKKEDEEALAKTREKEEQRLKEEEEKRKKEADERERKAKADEVLTAQATRQKVHVGEDTDQVRNRMLGKRAAPGAGPAVVEAPSKYAQPPKRSLAKPIAIGLVLILVAAFGAVHLMPVSTGDYERAASEALGRQVKIGSASLSLYSGLALHFKDVRVGDDVLIVNVSASPEFDALRGEKKVFNRIDLDGVKATQAALAEALLAKGRGENFALGRLTAKRVELAGPLALPKSVEVDITFAADGTASSATLRGPDNLVARLAPKGGNVDFEVTASGFPLPVMPDVTLSDFKMKGQATTRGMTINEWSGKLLSGELSGTADLRWGSGWGLDGVITARNVNAAVFAPALLSEGKAEGTGKFTMSGADPSKMGNDSRIEGSFTIGGGVLGSFDLRKAIQSGGKTWTGQTQFSELAGQAVYERGAVSLRGVTISAGTINAGATADIAQSGALSGRIVGDIKGGGRATLNLGGTAKEPQVRN